MKAIAVENILAQVLQMDGELNATIRTKSGDEYTFNIGDNEELMPESIEKDGILEIFCKEAGTAWIDIDSIESIRIK